MRKIIKFYATWSGPCKSYAPIFDKVAEKYKDQVQIYNVNVDKDTDGLAAEHKIRSMPTTVLVKEDGTILKKVGILSEIELEELIIS